MSQETVEIVRRFYAAANDGELAPGLDGLDPEIEFDWTSSISPYRGSYRGHAGVVEWLERARDAFSEFRFEPVELIDSAGSDQVIIVLRVRGRGVHADTLELTAEGAQVWTFTDGRATQMRLYQTKDEALAAVEE